MTEKSKKRDPYNLQFFPLDIDKFRRRTTLLTYLERSLLLTLMIESFSSILPDNEEDLIRVTQCDADLFKRLWPKVRPHFRIENGNIIHDEVEERRTWIIEDMEKKSEAGKAAAAAKKAKADALKASNAQNYQAMSNG